MEFDPNNGNNTLDIIKGQWSPDEDRILKELVKNLGTKKWSEAAKFVNGRNGKQCRDRWYNHLRPGIKKGPWTVEEEILLTEAHQEVGNKWVEIAKRIPGRSGNSVKNHWNAAKRSLKAKSAKFRTSDESATQSSIKEDKAPDEEKEEASKNKLQEVDHKSTDTDIGLMLTMFFQNYDIIKDASVTELFGNGGGA